MQLKYYFFQLLDELDKLPGDSRTQIGFITYDRVVHFYSMPEGKTFYKENVNKFCKQNAVNKFLYPM